MPNQKIGPPVLPFALRDVPKLVVSRLDASGILWDALSARRHPAPTGPVIAIYSIESALVAAQRQHRRIARAEKAPLVEFARTRASKRAVLAGRRNSRSSSVFDEVHFYLILWVRIARLAKFIAGSTKYGRVARVLKRYHSEIEDARCMRNDIEHLEERLPGGKKNDCLRNPNELYNMNLSHHLATFGGREFDVGPASIRLLGALVNELRSAILFDAADELSQANNGRISWHIKRASDDASVARIRKQVEKRFSRSSR